MVVVAIGGRGVFLKTVFSGKYDEILLSLNLQNFKIENLSRILPRARIVKKRIFREKNSISECMGRKSLILPRVYRGRMSLPTSISSNFSLWGKIDTQKLKIVVSLNLKNMHTYLYFLFIKIAVVEYFVDVESPPP